MFKYNEIEKIAPLKSTSPLRSVSNISITRCTRGFCCNSGNDINSSILKEPELSRSNLRNLLPNRFISSPSTKEKFKEKFISIYFVTLRIKNI